MDKKNKDLCPMVKKIYYRRFERFGSKLGRIFTFWHTYPNVMFTSKEFWVLSAELRTVVKYCPTRVGVSDRGDHSSLLLKS